MYSSMLIDAIRNRKSKKVRVIHGTVRLNFKSNDVYLKKAIFEKFHIACFNERCDPKDPRISMFIAPDVENSRSGSTNAETLKRPVCPHFHFVAIIPSESVKGSVSKLIQRAKERIMELDEVAHSDGSVWMQVANPKQWTTRRYKDPISDILEYDAKVYFQANARGETDFEPSIFPYQIEGYDHDESRRSRLFEKMMAKQDEFLLEKFRGRAPEPGVS